MARTPVVEGACTRDQTASGMRMSFSLQQIKPELIDCSDHSFVVSCGFDLTRLQASIQSLGLLSPPLLRQRQDGRYQIVCGYQRLLVVRQLGWPECPALVAPAETSAIWCLEASIHDNVFGRGLNSMETARMIGKLLDFCPEETICRRFFPLFGLPPSAAQFQKTRNLLVLEAPWQELVAKKRLSPEAGAQLSQWTQQDREAALPWFGSIQFSHSKQLEFLEYLITLSRRAGNSPAAWLERPEVLDLLADPVLSQTEKITRLWATLRHWCFPRSQQTQEQFQHCLKVLKLYHHPEIRLLPSPAFEDSIWRLDIRFYDKARLARHLQLVQEMLDLPEFEALLHL